MRTKGKTTHFAVGKTAGSDRVFQEIRTGKSVTRVMNERVYDEANHRAKEKIKEFVRDKKH